jgi:cobalt/nickel transport protein
MISNRKFIVMGVLVSALLAGGVSFYASSHPDGLEKVAEEIGFLETAKENTNAGVVFSDYGTKGVDSERASVGIAGVIGVLGTAVVAGVAFKLIARKPRNKKD